MGGMAVFENHMPRELRSGNGVAYNLLYETFGIEKKSVCVLSASILKNLHRILETS